MYRAPTTHDPTHGRRLRTAVARAIATLPATGAAGERAALHDHIIYCIPYLPETSLKSGAAFVYWGMHLTSKSCGPTLFRVFSIEEFFQLLKDSDSRHEYYSGIIWLMPGGTRTHNAIVHNLGIALDGIAKEKKCQISSHATLVEVPEPRAFLYPDLVVTCDPTDDDPRVVRKPALLAEVLSDSTAQNDLVVKRQAYLSLPSLLYYLIVSQDEPSAMLNTRGANGWEAMIYKGMEAIIDLPKLNTRLPMAEVYRNIPF